MSQLLVVERDGKFSTLLHSCSYLTKSKLGVAGVVHASISSQEAQAQGSGILCNLSEEDREGKGHNLSVQDLTAVGGVLQFASTDSGKNLILENIISTSPNQSAGQSKTSPRGWSTLDGDGIHIAQSPRKLVLDRGNVALRMEAHLDIDPPLSAAVDNPRKGAVGPDGSSGSLVRSCSFIFFLLPLLQATSPTPAIFCSPGEGARDLEYSIQVALCSSFAS